ncbi:hypothetical protein DFAR_3060039 [Desulfarculales bacterium]
MTPNLAISHLLVRSLINGDEVINIVPLSLTGVALDRLPCHASIDLHRATFDIVIAAV